MQFKTIFFCCCLAFITPQLQAQNNNLNYEKAISAFNQSQLDDAYIHLKNSLNDNPSHLPSKILMGQVLALSFYYQDAIIEFQEALQDNADPNLIMEYLANSLLIERQFNEIIALPEKGLSRQNLSILVTIKAKATVALGIDSPETLFKRAIALDPSSSNILNAYAQYLFNIGNVGASTLQINKALALSPTNTESLRISALLFRAQERQEEYVATLGKAISIDPDQPMVLRDLVSAYMATGQMAEAKQTLERVLAASGNDPMAKLLMSWVDSQLGNTSSSSANLASLVNELSLIDSEVIQNSYSLLYISGLANYALGNIEKAKQDMNKYLRFQPNNLKANMILADIYSAEGNYTGAINLLENFKEYAIQDLSFAEKLCDLYLQSKANHKCTWLLTQLEPNFGGSDIYISLKARAFAARGKLNEARQALDTIEVDSESLRVNKALLAIQDNDLTQASELLTTLISQRSDSQDYKNLLASVYLKSNELVKAKRLLQEIITSDPKHFSARFNLASTLFKQRELDASRAAASALLEERPTHTKVMLLLANVDYRSANYNEAITQLNDILVLDKDDVQAKTLLTAAYVSAGQNDNALIIANQLVKDHFLDPRFLTIRTNIHIANSAWNDAKEDLAKLFSVYANSPGSLLELSALQQQAQDIQGAIKSIDHALTLSNDNFYLLREKARLALSTGDMQSAKEAIARLVKQNSKDADTLLLQGDLAKATGDPELASKHYTKAIKLNPQFSQALVKRYQMAVQGVQSDAFAKLFEALVAKQSKANFVRNLLADYYLSQRQLQDAKAHYLLILKSPGYSNTALVLNNLAYVYLQEGNLDTALEHAQKANNILPNNQAILDTLGWSLVQVKKYEEGLSYLRQSFAMNTADPTLRYHLAYTLMKLNRQNDAKRELETLLANFDAFSERQLAQSLLETL